MTIYKLIEIHYITIDCQYNHESPMAFLPLLMKPNCANTIKMCPGFCLFIFGRAAGTTVSWGFTCDYVVRNKCKIVWSDQKNLIHQSNPWNNIQHLNKDIFIIFVTRKAAHQLIRVLIYFFRSQPP